MADGNGTPQPKGPLVLAILIITVGVGWLLTAQGIGPGINWVWTLGLGVVGFLAFVLSGGIDKLSVVFGPFFLVGSFLSILRQRGQLKVDTEIPILVIVLGVLLLVARLRSIPTPRWAIEPPRDRNTPAAS
jgi:hypothetical protein